MSTLRIGFIGCGLIARSHASNLADDPRVVIRAVHDLDRERATAFADRFCPAGPDAVRGDMASVIADVDAVYVCTWTSAHPEAVGAVVEAGRAVFCEKPLATDHHSAQAMCELVEAACVTNQVGLVLRYSPAFRVLRQVVRDPRSGPVMNLVFRDDQYLPTQGLYDSSWRAEVTKAGGGALLEHSIHDLDLIEWILGPIAEVQARTGSVHGIEGIEDQATAVLMAESGAQATLVSVWHDVSSRPSQRLVEVFCQRAYVSLLGDWQGPVRWDRTDGFDPPPPEATGELAGQALVDEANRVDGLGTNPDRAFIDAVVAGGTAHPSFATALRAHRLADATYRSARAGGTPTPAG